MHISSDHTHGHGAHPDLPPMSSEEVIRLLGFMLDHNRYHTEELHDLRHALEDAGKQEAADAVSAALHYFDHCNDALEDALKIAKGE
jgi:hypothetical protein